MTDAVSVAASDAVARPRTFSPELFADESSQQEASLPRWEKKQLTGAAIAPRSSHSASLTSGDRLWVYGGYGGENRKHDVLADFFCVETGGDRFEATPVVPLDRPEKRVGHCMLALQNNLYVTGGWNGKKYLNYGFLLDIESEHLLLEKHKGRVTPEARRDHSVVAMGRKLVLFGGWNIHEQFADVWVLDKLKWKWKQAETSGTAPSPRRGHSAVRVGKKMWVFGGIQGFSKYLDDTYVLDLETFEWSVPTLAGEAPSCRAWHSAVQLGNTAQILVFGGTAGRVNFYNDVFVLDTAKSTWFRLPTQGAPVNDKLISSPEEDLAAVGVSTGRPSGRCSHSATMVGSKMVVFGGLAPSAVDQKVYPLNELWVLETGLQLDRADEEEEPEDKEDEDEEADAAGLGATIGGTAFHSSAPLLMPSTLSPGAGADSEQPVEGWLSIFTPAVKEKKDDTWNRRYFRINGTDLLVYTQKEKGNLLVAEGAVKVWGERKNRFVRGSQIDALPKDVSTITLEDILSDPESPLAKHFLEFCKSIYSEENAQFYLDAESFKRLAEGPEQVAAATEIFEKFVRPGAPMQIDLPVVQQEQIKNDVNNKTIASAMFDNAQKRVLHVMRVDHLPKYSEHVMSLRARADQKFVLKTALTEQDRAVQACEHCLSKFSVFRARNWCRLCGDVYCGSCVNNNVRLPAKYGVAEPVRVCDQCAGDLNGLKFAFSLVSKRRSRPLNLAASSDKELRKWVAAFNRALQVPSHDREKAQAFAAGAGSAQAAGSPQPPSSPAAGPASPDSAAVPDGSKPTDSSSTDPVHLEGWLMKEDPSTKTYRKRYFILHHNQLFYYQLTLQHEFMSLPGGEINVVSAAEPTLLETRPRSGSEDDGSSAYPCLKGGFKLGSGFAYRFNITTATNTSPSTQTTFKLAADSEQDRLQWVDTIHKVTQAKPSDIKPAAARPKPPPIVTTASVLSLTDTKDSSMVSPASPSSPLTPVSPRAPEGPSGEVVFVCADVEGSTALWEGAPEATNEALHSNQELLKRLSVQHKGYPVKSQLDSFMFTFASAKDAAYWCAAVQSALLQLEWPHELLAVPEAKRETDGAGAVLFNGVRMRMSIVQGQPRCRANPITGRVEYSGPVLHTAAALSESAHGGQVVMSEEVYHALQHAIAAEESERKERADAELAADEDSDDSGADEPAPPPPPPQSSSPQLVFADLGMHALPLPTAAADDTESKGEDAPPPPPGSTALRVFQMLPKGLEGRSFPPLRAVNPNKPPPAPPAEAALVAEFSSTEEVPGPPPS